MKGGKRPRLRIAPIQGPAANHGLASQREPRIARAHHLRARGHRPEDDGLHGRQAGGGSGVGGSVGGMGGGQLIKSQPGSANDNGSNGSIACRSRLGDLLNYYQREAA